MGSFKLAYLVNENHFLFLYIKMSVKSSNMKFKIVYSESLEIATASTNLD